MRLRLFLIQIPFLLTLLCFPPSTLASEKLGISGYAKIIAAGYDRAGYQGGGFVWSKDTRARIDARFIPVEWLGFDLSYDLRLRLQDKKLFEPDLSLVFAEQTIYRVRDLDSFLYPDDVSGANNAAILQNLDRFMLTFSAPKFDFIVGRQAIAWGSAHAINPTDVFAPYLYNEIDTEHRIGVDTARLRIPAGSLGEIDAGYVAGKNLEAHRSAGFFRYKFYAANTDLAVLLAGFRENTLVGFDVTRSLAGAGFWVEAAYVFIDGLNGRNRRDEQMDYLRASLGLDYNFARGIYVFGEYHYNEAGSGEPGEYLGTPTTAPYREGAVYLLGRHYLIPGVSVQVTPLTTVLGEALLNLTDSSVLLAPSVEYSLSDNFYFMAGAFVGLGKSSETILASTYYGTNGLFAGDRDVVIPLYRSEFGAYPGVYYLSLRYYF